MWANGVANAGDAARAHHALVSHFLQLRWKTTCQTPCDMRSASRNKPSTTLRTISRRSGATSTVRTAPGKNGGKPQIQRSPGDENKTHAAKKTSSRSADHRIGVFWRVRVRNLKAPLCRLMECLPHAALRSCTLAAHTFLINERHKTAEKIICSPAACGSSRVLGGVWWHRRLAERSELAPPAQV